MTTRLVPTLTVAQSHPDIHRHGALTVANDNIARDTGRHVPSLTDALEHFAKFGLQSARAAWEQAETAYRNGEMAAYEHWLNICRMFDGPYTCRMKRNLLDEALSA